MPSIRQVVMCGRETYRSMFVCVGLIGNSSASEWMDAEGAMVFTDSSHLLPLWLVDFAVGTNHPVRPTPRRHYLSPAVIRLRSLALWVFYCANFNQFNEVTFQEKNRKRESQRKVNRINRLAERKVDQ